MPAEFFSVDVPWIEIDLDLPPRERWKAVIPRYKDAITAFLEEEYDDESEMFGLFGHSLSRLFGKVRVPSVPSHVPSMPLRADQTGVPGHRAQTIPQDMQGAGPRHHTPGFVYKSYFAMGGGSGWVGLQPGGWV